MIYIYIYTHDDTYQNFRDMNTSHLVFSFLTYPGFQEAILSWIPMKIAPCGSTQRLASK